MQYMQNLNDYDSLDMTGYNSAAVLPTSRNTIAPKTELCRYHMHAGGCVRGSSCYFAHSDTEFLMAPRYSRTPLEEIKQGYTSNIDPRIISKKSTEDLGKKVFVGGLSPAVDSDDLRDYFESHFGTVSDAIVIGSQAGDSSFSSRGFGFVTFKHESSVLHAVKEHFVLLFGKKVEVKSAVPRPIMQAAEMSVEAARHQQQLDFALKSRHRESMQDDSTCKSCHGTSIGSPNIENAWHLPRNRGAENSEAENINLEEPTEVTEGTGLEISPVPLPLSHGPRPQWLLKLRSWLPKFLTSVSNRLFEGEWYPLSSLKGDFRATCGMELDHVTIGYPKLSDFVRSLSNIVRMKIVPVGRGPATHMVLLPPVSRPEIFGPNKAHSFRSSLVDAGRSYAAVAQSKSLAPSEGSSEEAISASDVSGGYMYESYKQALVEKTAPTETEDEQRAGSERPVTSHNINPDAEYISELMSLLSRPESESQRAVIEAYRQISQKTGGVEKENDGDTSQDDGEGSNQGHSSQISSNGEHPLSGPKTPQPLHRATTRVEDVLPDSPFNQCPSIPPMSPTAVHVPLSRAAGSALIHEIECNNVSGEEDANSQSPTNMHRVRALLSEYGKNPEPDLPRDQWPQSGSRRSSLEDVTSCVTSHENLRPIGGGEKLRGSERFVIDRLVGPPRRSTPHPPEQQQGSVRNTGIFSSGIDTKSGGWLPWHDLPCSPLQAPPRWFAPPLPPGPPPFHHRPLPYHLQMQSPRPASMHPGHPMSMRLGTSLNGSPGVGEELTCILCWERRASCVNVPCGHRSLCTTCKDLLQCQPGPHFCMCCNHLVQGWRT